MHKEWYNIHVDTHTYIHVHVHICTHHTQALHNTTMIQIVAVAHSRHYNMQLAKVRLELKRGSLFRLHLS